MKVIIAGSRSCNDYNLVRKAIKDSGFDITEIVSGCAPGIDTVGMDIANEYHIPVKRFPANWNRYGKGAGLIRNIEMAEYADALVALPGPNSVGTIDMIAQARLKGLKIYVKEVE
jgi:hypothetical protein